ncbi:MAG: retropepsin-like aspartic protease [Candidatus Rokuibacteriota bacterium]
MARRDGKGVRGGLAALATILALGATPAAAQLYRWTDAEGIVYYTTDPAAIPARYRESATDIGSPTPGPPEAMPAAPRGVVIPYAGGPLVVDASLNGVPLRLLVDTGAERTLISPIAMARAGFDVATGTSMVIRGVTGDATATMVVVPRLDVAGMRAGPLGVIAHVLAVEGVDGLLGRDVLDAFTVTVDAPNGRALLTPR